MKDEEIKLLIVDDDPRTLRSQATLLEGVGYQVVQAGTGQEALHMARDIQPDLVLLDVILPDVDGVEVCRRIKADPALAQTFVVLLSGVSAAPEEQVEGLEAGADSVIARPIANRELLARLEALLRIQRAQEALHASETRYRDLFQNAPIGIYRTAPEGDILMANPTLVDMLGYDSFEELAQRNLESEGYHPDYPRSAFKASIAAEGGVTGLESAWQRKDGSTLFVRENARPVYDERGQLVAYQGTVEDVTERVERTRRLKRLNTLLDAIGDVNQILVHESDPVKLIDGTCDCLIQAQGYHAAFIALWGDEGRPRYVAQAGACSTVAGLMKELQRGQLQPRGEALSQPGIWVLEPAEAGRQDDASQDQDLRVTPLMHAGTTYGLMMVATPATIDVDDRERVLLEEVASDVAFALHNIQLEREHQEADRALRESERRQSLILDATVELFVYHDTDLRVQWVNRAAADSVGLTREDLVGRHCYQIWAQRDDPCPNCPVLRARETGEPQETEQTTPDGRVWFVRGYPIVGEGGEVEALVEFAQDITEQTVAQRALRESESRFRRIYESNMIGISYWDAADRIVDANEVYLDMIGYTQDDLEANTLRWSDLTPPEYAALDEKGMEEIMEQGFCSPYEKAYIRKDGRRVPVLIGGASVEGDSYEGISYAIDITERKEAEEQLALRRQLWDALMANTPDLVYFKDADHGLIRASQAYADAVGLPQEEMVGKTAAELWPREAERIIADERRVLAGEPIIQKEREATTATGEPRWYLLTKIPIYRDDEVIGFFAIDKDITERKLAEQEQERLAAQLQDQARRLEQILATVPEGVLLLDDEHRILHANPKAKADLDALAHADVGDVLTELGDCSLVDVLTSPPQGLWHQVDASERTFQVIARPMEAALDEAGDGRSDTEHWVLVFKDVTREQAIQKELQQQERLAAIGQLAGGVAHDFNNILGAIMLFAQMPLGSPDLSPRTTDALETILAESRRAADLVQQILDFSRSSMMETKTLSLTALAEETLGILGRTIPESIRLVRHLTPHPCTVKADATRIHQVLMNLALNAKDAMPDGGELRIAIDHVDVPSDDDAPLPEMGAGSWARMTVADTGTGLTEEAQEHLFEPFFSTKEGQGTGLGLAQVYGIVKQHNGFIDVETARGEGTTFTVFLPLLEGVEAEGIVASQRRFWQAGSETILVAEDAEQLRRAIQNGLTSLGYEVLTAANGREALETLPEHTVDLVLTDVVMPELGGEALLRHLRSTAPDLRVIAMTGHATDTDIQQLRAAGFAEAIHKPFSIEKLTEMIRNVLDRPA